MNMKKHVTKGVILFILNEVDFVFGLNQKRTHSQCVIVAKIMSNRQSALCIGCSFKHYKLRHSHYYNF